MSKLSKLAKDLRRSSKLTSRQALMLKGGDDKRMGGGFSGRGRPSNGGGNDQGDNKGGEPPYGG